MKSRESLASKANRFRPGNNLAAEIILADPAKWGGEQGALVQWARLHGARNGLVNVNLAPPVNRKPVGDGRYMGEQSKR